MARQTGDEDVRTGKRPTRRTEDGSAVAGSGEHRTTAVQSATKEGWTGSSREALQQLLMRDDGWLRAIPDGAGKTAYLKWKFTRGCFTGSYVMVVIRPWEGDDGFRMLLAKIMNCYAGNRRPTPDKAYLPIFDDERLPE
jgi:hypothetical protein